MPFPTSPTNGQTTTLNNITYTYVSSTNSWVRNAGNISGVTGLTISGQANVGSLITQGNILPGANVSYNLGSPTQRFNSLYLSGNTIDLSGATIKTDATTGAVAIVAQPTASNPNPTGIVVSPTGAISTVATTAGVVSAGAVATASNAATPTTTIPLISNVVVTDSSWNVLDDTAVGTTGGYIRLTGSGFDATSTVLINNTPATATTYANSTTLNVQVPALSTGTYNLYVVNSNGATGIRVNGLTSSTFTAWSTNSTLANVITATSFGVNLSATSDSSITYANTTALPAGTTLASNGYFYGSTTVGATTTYSFTVNATDAELQNATRTFSLTVTVAPLYKLWMWGYGGQGAQGQNNVLYYSSPTQVGADTNWSSVSGGIYHTNAIKSDGTLWGWGSGSNFGSTGLNELINRSSPTQVGALTTWLKVHKGGYWLGGAIKTDGTLWTWGQNSNGQLGVNDIVTRSSPTQVGGTTWSDITFSSSTAIAIKTNGTLWSWGGNSQGESGLNDSIKRSSPIQVGTDTNWSMVASSSYAFVALKTNGTLWSWGQNSGGQLGLNITGTYRSSPTQIGALTNWSAIASSGGNTGSPGYFLALKTDGTLWCCGGNAVGQLGLNNRNNASSPTQIGAGTTWSSLGAGWQFGSAIKTDGTLWMWGKNENGQLGQNDKVYRSSPTQVGAGTNWYSLTQNLSYLMRAITRD